MIVCSSHDSYNTFHTTVFSSCQWALHNNRSLLTKAYSVVRSIHLFTGYKPDTFWLPTVTFRHPTE